MSPVHHFQGETERCGITRVDNQRPRRVRRDRRHSHWCTAGRPAYCGGRRHPDCSPRRGLDHHGLPIEIPGECLCRPPWVDTDTDGRRSRRPCRTIQAELMTGIPHGRQFEENASRLLYSLLYIPGAGTRFFSGGGTPITRLPATSLVGLTGFEPATT